ncbi:MAG: hypothetical protein JJE22_04900 [Bacteroidia bacterium]|nr:hypothetical protein [Bacteroidia bacterium]
MDKGLEKEHQRTYTYHFFFVHGLFEKLFHLEDFITSTDKYLKKELFQRIKIEKKLKNINSIYGAENQLENVFPEILWRTTFLHIYNLAESSLDEICRNIQEVENYDLMISDMFGKGINRAALYLQKVAKKNQSFQTEYWYKLNDFNKIRNILVHSGAIVGINNKEIIRIINKYTDKGISLPDFDGYEYSEINFKKEFCVYTLETVKTFFEILHVNLNDKKNELF